MLRLAVTTEGITTERMRNPLAQRGIELQHLPIGGRTIDADPATADFPEVDVGYVYPSRLMEGGVADACLDIPWVNPRDVVLRSRNKAGVLALAAREGHPTPRSTLVSNPVEEGALVDLWSRFDGPVVVKPNSTTRGVGVTRADDLDSFLGITDYLDLVHDYRATGDKSYLVQEFVPDARDLRVMVVDGTYAGAVERRAPDRTRWKHNVHRGAEARGIDAPASARALAESIADLLGARVLGVDVLVTEARTLLSETNARPTIDRVEKYEDGFWDRLARTIEACASGYSTSISEELDSR